MFGIDLNQPLEYFYASLRCFKEGEHHVTRICGEDVLLLVYDGILRFEEDGISYEIYPGQYHIQKQGSFQQGVEASSTPKYLYVHFRGSWTDRGRVLGSKGEFSSEHLFQLIQKMDYLAHSDASLIECNIVFLQILCKLYEANQVRGAVDVIADYIAQNAHRPISLEELSQKFSYSKNHIINLFKKEYQMTPIEYLIAKRIERAQWLLEASGDTMEVIAEQCGFSGYSHLYKAFIKKHGKTPGKWRREKRMYPYVNEIR